MTQVLTSPLPPAELAGALLTVDLAAIQANWRLLASRAPRAQCAAAVKGDAYGLGLGPVARALAEAGCANFFVARPHEGQELRALLPRAAIYVLDGLLPGQAEYYATLDLRPALTSTEEAREWAAFGRVYGRRLPCALHVDTGINRLGFSEAEALALRDDGFVMEGIDVALLMSHLACADDPPHALNARQRDRFAALRAAFPGVPASLANSAGIFLGDSFSHDLLRPGIALYGGNPLPGRPNPMQPVARLEAAVLQLRHVKAGATVGYGATWAAPRDSRVAILGAGYKDGIPRALSSGAGGGPAAVAIAGRRCPVVGRISMDMMAADVTALSEAEAQRGARAEIFGAAISVDEVAAWAGTISYELLTRIGTRYARHYTPRESEPS